jgi:hypothetical protein
MDTTPEPNTPPKISPEERERARAAFNEVGHRGRPWQPTALDVKLNRGSALMFFAGLQTPLPPKDRPPTSG